MAERKAKFENREQPSKQDMEARRAEMMERLAAKVASGEITQAEADEFRSKMAERKAKFENREQPSKQ